MKINSYRLVLLFRLCPVVALLIFMGVSTSESVRCINILKNSAPNDYKSPEKCRECHRPIFFSWRQSRHAASWTSQTYVDTSQKRSKEKCFPCHIPHEIKPGEKPVPREDSRQLGIYCIPCHLSEKSLHGGEMDIFSQSPSNEKDIDFRDPFFCGSCHKKTLEEWKTTGVKESCQKCHMKPFQQTVDHGFKFLKSVTEAVGLNGAIVDGMIQVTLVNRAIPHLYPTAENGDPRLLLYTRFFDRTGDEIEKYRETLAPQQDTSLGFKKEVIYEYERPENADRVEIKLFYRPAWSREMRMVRDVFL